MCKFLSPCSCGFHGWFAGPRRPSVLNFLGVAMLALAALGKANGQDDGFKSLFDGKTLERWEGNPKFWSVKDGAITGQTTDTNKTEGNTFIIWRGGDVKDFELKLQFRIVGGNSGIQYRSKEVEKWVIAGYQADFDSKNEWTGTLYEERGRGVLARRGDQVRVHADGTKGKVGMTAEEKEILAKVKSEDWNDYRVLAVGNHLEHFVNGIKTVDLVDEEEAKRAMSGLLALQLHAGPAMKVQFRDIKLREIKLEAKAKQGAKKRVVFVAGRASHGYGAHEHYAGSMILAESLQRAMPGFDVQVIRDGWPADATALDGADCVVMYADGGGGHPANPHLAEIDKLAEKGVGVVCIHYAVEVPKGDSGDHFLKWIGGYFEMNWSVNPHWTANFKKLPDHPITRGVQPFAINDEWYYHMRFRDKMEGVTPILTDLPPESTLSRPDGAHSGNPDVRAAVLQRKEPQHVAWASQRANGQRGFGFTGGHDHWNWGEPNFRKVVLNAIVWCAHGDVPEQGVSDRPVSLEDLERNQDEPQPDNFNRDEIRKRLNLPANTAAAPKKKLNAEPVFRSQIITTQTPGHATDVDVAIAGAKQLFLVVRDGGNGFSCDWADWAEPRLMGPAGEKKLTELKWKSATTDFGRVRVGQNADGGKLMIDGQPVAFGIGTHANSVIAFDLPEGYQRFQARGGLDQGGTGQAACGAGASVQFLVYTSEPNLSPSGSPTHDPGDAIAGLDVADGLEATLFASEPLLLNPTNIDIDHLGRVWVCEVVNYRRFANVKANRPEGDRILILTDTDHDGVADDAKVFYQGQDIDSAHGICLLPTEDGKGTRAIVSAGDSVFFLIDKDGDDRADEKKVLFTGISGVQHDHGIHAFVFGPDGKLYFNFGNEGKQLKDAAGKPIVDKSGATIAENRPYQQGMVFRCNLDGSQVETLGWNFRNNWEVSTDSFGTLWQSDNDDDGNKGVRINFVMEFGNYGYKDEMTGAGWQAERTGWEEEIPRRHWHLNDPGVVPNLLLTGAGSPTGICVYEGRLLPKQFWGQVIHCDAGPNVVRAYPASKDGAGYKAEMVNVLHGARDNWFRPSDVCVAPDGSLLIADWYDPGVGGHKMEDVERGRIFRVAPPGAKYAVPKVDFNSIDGAIAALASPNLATRTRAWLALHGRRAEAEPALEKLLRQDDPRLRARAIWLLGKIPGRGPHWVEEALKDADSDLRIVGVRLARQLEIDVVPIAKKLARDPSPQLRRELAIALRGIKTEDAARAWADLAAQHDGKDRWYLEALGIGSTGNADRCFAAWLKTTGEKWNTPAGRDIIWRVRAPAACDYLARILKDESTSPEDQPRYFRAFDFHAGPEKDAALKSILGQ